MVGVGHEAVINTSCGIGVRDQAQWLLDTVEADGLIVGDARALPPGPFEQILGISVTF